MGGNTFIVGPEVSHEKHSVAKLHNTSTFKIEDHQYVYLYSPFYSPDPADGSEQRYSLLRACTLLLYRLESVELDHVHN